MPGKLIIVGEHNPAWETHRATTAAIDHSLLNLGTSLEVKWCSTLEVIGQELADAGGFWIATGAPYQSMDRALEVIRHAREHGVPCLGTCQGFQHIMLEYAQTFMGIAHPGHEEYGGGGDKPFISALPCSLRGQELAIDIREGSRAFDLYGTARTTERYYCSYGISPEFAPLIRGEVMRVSGMDPNGEIRIVEFPDHPFMMGTLFVPQARSRPDHPHPIVSAFLRTILAT